MPTEVKQQRMLHGSQRVVILMILKMLGVDWLGLTFIRFWSPEQVLAWWSTRHARAANRRMFARAAKNRGRTS